MLLNHLGRDEYPRTSLLIGSDDQWHFASIPDSRAILERILQLYWQGMRMPLPLFPRTSLAYAKEIMNGDKNNGDGSNSSESNGGDIQRVNPVAMSDDARALNAARLSWEGNNFNQIGERNDPCFSLCFGKVRDPLGEDFKTLARDIFGPILACCKQDLEPS